MAKSGIAPNNKSLIIYAITGIISISVFLFLDVFENYEIGDWRGRSELGGEPMIDTLVGYAPFYISSIFCLSGIVYFIVGCFRAKGHPQSLWKWAFYSVICIFVYIFLMDGNGSRSPQKCFIRVSYDSLGFILYLITSTIWLITSIILSRKQK